MKFDDFEDEADKRVERKYDVIINPDNILHLEDLPKDPFFDAFKQGLLSDKPFGMIIRSDGEVKLWEQK